MCTHVFERLPLPWHIMSGLYVITWWAALPPPLQVSEACLPTLYNLFRNPMTTFLWHSGKCVTQHVTETRNQEHSSQSYSLVCQYTSLHAERVWERQTVYVCGRERLDETEIG